MQDQRAPVEVPPPDAASPDVVPLPRLNMTTARWRRDGLRDLFEREREERRGYRRPPETASSPPAAATGPNPDNCFSDD